MQQREQCVWPHESFPDDMNLITIAEALLTGNMGPLQASLLDFI